VAEIAPFGEGPGLVAFICTDCGAARSTLLYADRSRWADHEQRNVEFRVMPSGDGASIAK
jgi:hypothetical protein